jgi:tRNA1(Val) A37 N6-methylase TrmN6
MYSSVIGQGYLKYIQLAGSRQGLIIVDFCSGGGHLGLLLAHLLSEVSYIFAVAVTSGESHLLRLLPVTTV